MIKKMKKPKCVKRYTRNTFLIHLLWFKNVLLPFVSLNNFFTTVSAAHGYLEAWGSRAYWPS